MNDNKLEICVPCDPASARRPSVPGLEGVKSVTEGGGGVGPQAPSPANAPGANAAVAASSTSSVASAPSGPVLSIKKKRKNPKKRMILKKREMDAAAAGPGAALGVGGPGTICGSQPKVGTSTTTSQQLSWKQQRKERRQRDEELTTFVLNHRILEGTMHPSGVSALSPALGAVFARPTLHKLVETTPPVPRCEPIPLLSEPCQDRSSETVSCAGPSSAGWAAPRQQDGATVPTKTTKPGFTPEAVKLGVSDVSLSASWDRGPTNLPKPHKGKGKGKGKAVVGGRGDQPGIPASSAPTTPGNTRGAKRQRSSDLVSPSTAAADKRVRMETSPPSSVVVASSEGHLTNDGTGAAVSYAEAAKSHHKVVILDKAGANFTELQAAVIRMELEDGCTEFFSQMSQSTNDFHTLQRLNFGALPRLFRGGLRVEAKDEFSLNWLTNLVNNLPGKWPGSGGYKLVAEHELPAFLKGTVYVPYLEGDASHVRKFLSFSNDTETLRIRNWQIFVHNIIRTSTAQHNVMVFGIPAEDEPELRKMDCRLQYKMGTVHILLRKPRAGDVRNAIEAPAAAASSCDSMDVVEVEAPNPVVVNVPCPEESDLTAEIDRVIQAMAGGGGEAGGDLSCLSLESPAADMPDDLSGSADGSLPSQ